jgi:hypothetical protein
MMSNKYPWLVLAALFCLLSCIHALTMQVEPKTEECFYQFVDKEKDITILYSVTRGGLLDIDVRVYCFFLYDIRIS